MKRLLWAAMALMFVFVLGLGSPAEAQLFENAKIVMVRAYAAGTDPLAAAWDSWVMTSVDTVGYRKATLIVRTGACVTGLQITCEQCDTANGTYATIASSTVGTLHSDKALANQFFAIDIKMDGKARFLKPSVMHNGGATGTFITAFVLLTMPEITPSNSNQRGVAAYSKI